MTATVVNVLAVVVVAVVVGYWCGRMTGSLWRAAPLRWAWPAYLCAAALLVYAVEKGYRATQGRIGIPGGPKVPDSAYQQLGHVALRQWTLAALGVAGALLALASVLAIGRRVPRWLMLFGLWGTLLPTVAGFIYVVRDSWTSGQPLAVALLRTVLALAQVSIWPAVALSYTIRIARRTTAERAAVPVEEWTAR